MVKSFPSSSAVKKIRSPQMHGEDAPGGAATFQRNAESASSFTGGFFDGETPEPFGPRKRGQLSSADQALEQTRIKRDMPQRRRCGMRMSFRCAGMIGRAP